MRAAWFHRHRTYVGLVLAHAATVILFALAGVAVAGRYLPGLPDLVAVVLGTAVGMAAALFVGYATVADRRHADVVEAERHADARVRADQLARARAEQQAASRRNSGRPAPDGTRIERTGTGAARLRPSTGLAGAAAAASTFTQAAHEGRFGGVLRDAENDPGLLERMATDLDQGRFTLAGGPPASTVAEAAADSAAASAAAVDAEADAAIGALCDLMLVELRPDDLVGQQGRGVMQLAALLGPRVPLAPETVVAYISDHVLVAAGQHPHTPQQWHGVLDRVSVLHRDGAEDLADLLGIDRAAGGTYPGPTIDAIVSCIAHSGGGLGLGRLGVALDSKNYRLSPYVLAVLVKHLVDIGRLERPADGWRYRLTAAEVERRATTSTSPAVERTPPLDVVYSVLADGPAEGMTVDQVAAEVERRRSMPCPQGSAARAIRMLLSADRINPADTRGRYVARVHGLITGPGLTERIRTAVQAEDGGLTVAELTERVDADGFGAGESRVRDMANRLVDRGELVMNDDRYQEPPF